MAASTASMCLRSCGLSVSSQTYCQASSRVGRWVVAKSEDLLARAQQLLVLPASADGDAQPARDRLPFIVADQDPAPPQLLDDLAGFGWRPDEDKVGG